MTVYSPQQPQDAMQKIYEENTAKRLKAMKIARHLNTLSNPIRIRAEMPSDLYSVDFQMHYIFYYNQYDIINPWLKEMVTEHPVKDSVDVNSMNFTYEGEVNGEQVSVNVYGLYNPPQ